MNSERKKKTKPNKLFEGARKNEKMPSLRRKTLLTRRKDVTRRHDAPAEHIVLTIRVENGGISVQKAQQE